MSQDIQKNELHYYIDLLRMPASIKHTTETNESAVRSLYNIIRTMRLIRHNKICGEDFSELDFGNIPLNDIYWSYDGEKPCSFHGCSINEWNFKSGHYNTPFTVTWSPDGRFVLSVEGNGTYILWDAESGLMVEKKEHDNTDNHLSFVYFAVDDNGYRLKTQDFLLKPGGFMGELMTADFSPNVKLCVTYFRELRGPYLAQIWAANSDQYLHLLKGHRDRVQDIVISSSGMLCLTGSMDRTAKIWNTKTGECVHTLCGHNHPVVIVAFSDDEAFCITGSTDGTIILWDAFNGTLIHLYTGHTNQITSLSFSHNGSFFLSGSLDGEVKLHDINTGISLQTFMVSTKWINCISISPDNSYFVASNVNGDLLLWSIKTGQCITKLSSYEMSTQVVDFSVDGNRFASGSKDGVITQWELKTGKYLNTLERHSDPIRAMKVLCKYKNKDIYISGSKSEIKVLWDYGEKVYAKEYILDCFYPKIFISANEEFCLLKTSCKKAIIINLDSRDTICTITDFDVQAATFTNDCRYCIVGSDRGVLEVWDIHSKDVLTQIHTSHSIISLAGSMDGKLCLIGTSDVKAKAIVWNIETNSLIQELVGHKQPIIAVKILSNQQYCMTFSNDHTVKKWNIYTGECIQTWSNPSEREDSFRWDFPYYSAVKKNKTELWRLALDNADNIVSQELISVFYQIDNLFIKGCDFRQIQSDLKTSQIIYQYGGVTDETEVK